MGAVRRRTRSALAVGAVTAALSVALCLAITLAGPERPRPQDPAPDRASPPWAQHTLAALAVGVAGFVVGFGLQFLLAGLKPERQGSGAGRQIARHSLEREIGNVEEIAALCIRRAHGAGRRGGEPGTRAKTQAQTQRGTQPADPDGR